MVGGRGASPPEHVAHAQGRRARTGPRGTPHAGPLIASPPLFSSPLRPAVTCSRAAGPRHPRSAGTAAPRPAAAAYPARQAPRGPGALGGRNPEPPAASAAPREKQRNTASAPCGGEGPEPPTPPRVTHRRAGLRHDGTRPGRPAHGVAMATRPRETRGARRERRRLLRAASPPGLRPLPSLRPIAAAPARGRSRRLGPAALRGRDEPRPPLR